MKENNFTKEQLRIKAIELHNNKWKVTEICKALKCSRKWFYKWLKRYQNYQTDQGNNSQWYIEKSRRPKTQKKKNDTRTEQLIIETRKELMLTPFMQYGPQAIYYTLEMRGIVLPPPVWSIARILNQSKITHRKKRETYIPKGKKYPYKYILSQQMDFAGPRYLYSKTRFYFHNLICCDTHYAQAIVYESQESTNVCNSIIRFWKTAGVPDYLQMDNDLAFWGSLNKPNALKKSNPTLSYE